MERGDAPVASWIAVNANPHRERLVLENLQRQGLNAYCHCPMIRRPRSHARLVETVLCPPFPGYLFVEANAAPKRWRPIPTAHGMRSVVRIGDDLSFIDGSG